MMLANPSPLALFGFAMPTILLSVANIGIFSMNGALLGLAIAHGGLSQLVVGILLFFKGATFGHVAFFSYGAFWWSVAILVAMPGIAPAGYPAPDGAFMGAFFLLWGIFTFFCWICTLRQNRVVQGIFLTLWITFMLLSIANWNPASNTLEAAGAFGVICGCLAFYLGLAELLNESVGRVLLPIGDPANAAKEREFLANWALHLFTSAEPHPPQPEASSTAKASIDALEKGQLKQLHAAAAGSASRGDLPAAAQPMVESA